MIGVKLCLMITCSTRKNTKKKMSKRLGIFLIILNLTAAQGECNCSSSSILQLTPVTETLFKYKSLRFKSTAAAAIITNTSPTAIGGLEANIIINSTTHADIHVHCSDNAIASGLSFFFAVYINDELTNMIGTSEGTAREHAGGDNGHQTQYIHTDNIAYKLLSPGLYNIKSTVAVDSSSSTTAHISHCAMKIQLFEEFVINKNEWIDVNIYDKCNRFNDNYTYRLRISGQWIYPMVITTEKICFGSIDTPVMKIQCINYDAKNVVVQSGAVVESIQAKV